MITKDPTSALKPPTVLEVTGELRLILPIMVPSTVGPSKPGGLAFDKSISRLLDLGPSRSATWPRPGVLGPTERSMEFECGKVELGTSMKRASVPIWNVQLEWPLHLRKVLVQTHMPA